MQMATTHKALRKSLTSVLEEMDEELGRLAKRYLQYYDPRSACPTPRAASLEKPYQECLSEFAPRIQGLCKRLHLEPFMTLHGVGTDRPIAKVLDPYEDKPHVVAAVPRPYPDLKRSIDLFKEYLQHPPQKGEVRPTAPPQSRMKWQLSVVARNQAEACCIDDDATLSLIEEVFVPEGGGLEKLADAVIFASVLISEGYLVLSGDTESKMRALAVVAWQARYDVTPEVAEWADRKGIVPLSQKAQLEKELSEILASRDDEALSLDRRPGEGEAGASVFQLTIPTKLDELGAALESGRGESPGSREFQERVSAPKPRGIDAGNAFQKQGDVWHITYNGDFLAVRDSKGARIVHYLLRHQGQSVPATTLSQFAERKGSLPRPVSPNQFKAPTASHQEPPDNRQLSITSGDSALEHLDPQAVREYRSRLKQLQQDRSEAESEHNDAALHEVDREVEQIERQLSRDVNIHGDSRKSGASAQKAAKAIRTSIGRFKNHIRKDLPALVKHLDKSITREGTAFSYTPQTSPCWRL